MIMQNSKAPDAGWTGRQTFDQSLSGKDKGSFLPSAFRRLKLGASSKKLHLNRQNIHLCSSLYIPWEHFDKNPLLLYCPPLFSEKAALI